MQLYCVWDILAVAPFWLNDIGGLSKSFQPAEVLSLFASLFWLLKLCRYFSGWYLLSKALTDSLKGRLLSKSVDGFIERQGHANGFCLGVSFFRL